MISLEPSVISSFIDPKVSKRFGSNIQDSFKEKGSVLNVQRGMRSLFKNIPILWVVCNSDNRNLFLVKSERGVTHLCVYKRQSGLDSKISGNIEEESGESQEINFFTTPRKSSITCRSSFRCLYTRVSSTS